MDGLFRDLRYAVRTLSKSPGFTLVAVLTLALGIGGTAAVFPALELAVLRLPPYPDVDRLVAIDVTSTRSGSATDSIGWSYPKFETMRGAASFLELVTATTGRDVTIAGGAEPARVRAEAVSPSYFVLLGARPAIGRVLVDDDDAEAHAGVVVLSHATWRSVFGGDSSVIGRTVRVNSVPTVVVGVARPGFAGLGGNAAAWVPVHALPLLTNSGVLQRRWAHGFTGFARLRAGVTLGQARTAMHEIGRIVDAAHPLPGGGTAQWGAALAPFGDVRTNPLGRTLLFVLAGAVGLVLLLTCVNVANMQLARAVAREREIIVRSALGAGRRRLVQQLLTESLVLTGAGGIAGLGTAAWGVALLRGAIPDIVSSHGVQFLRADALGLDLGSLVLTGVVVIAAGVLMGFVPAWRLSRPAAAAVLRAGVGQQSRGMGSLRRMTLRGGLVAAQLTLATVLLVGAGLMLRTLARLAAVDPGFEAESVLSLRYGVTRGDAGVPNLALFHAAVLDRFRALPGVRGVAMSSCAPLSGCYDILTVSRIDGRPPFAEGEAPAVRTNYVTDDYFQVLGITLRAGRSFDSRDQATSAPVIVLSQTAARRIYGTTAAVGRQIAPTVEPFSSEHMGEVIGVVADVKQVRMQEEPQADVYISLRQVPYGEPTVLLRTAGDPLAVLPAARAAMRELARDVPLYDVKPLPQLVREASARERLISTSLAAFAILGLVLAGLGVYGVVSFSVAQRTHEVGVRMALGARAPDVVRLVVGQGFVMVGVGLALGVTLALALTRTLRGVLFGVTPNDPLTMAAVAVLLLAVAFLASYLPARRAARVDPMVALRNE